jgi:hypothetical protein
MNTNELEESIYEIIDYYNVNKFIKIDKGIIELLFNIKLQTNDKPISVLTIIGPARRGKSTLINCIISTLLNTNYNSFKTSDTNDHYTYGIDYTIIETEDKNILFLDVQGMGLHDSSNDCKILLYIYLISDLIIFNERNIIDNRTLDYLLPLTSFITYINESILIEQNKHPKIIFRISDQDLKMDPQENLNKVLEFKNDQYQNIRESIKKLFSELVAIKTETLEKSEKSLLENKNYNSFLLIKQNNFKNICDYIIQEIHKCNKFNNFSTYYEYIQRIALDLNENKKIDWDKLDLTKQISKQEIDEWIKNNIDEKYYKNIEVNGTQEQFEKFVLPLKQNLDKIILNYENYFANTTPLIRDEEKKNIYYKLHFVYNNAYEQTKNKSTSKIIEKSRDIINKNLNNYFFKENETEEAYLFINKLKETIYNDKIINLYFYDIKKNILDYLENIIFKFMKNDITKIKNNYDKKYNDKIKILESVIEQNTILIWDDILKGIKNIYLSFDQIKKNMYNYIKAQLSEFNLEYSTHYFILENIYKKENYPFKITEYKNIDHNINYDLSIEKTKLLEKYEIEFEKYRTTFKEYRIINLPKYLIEIKDNITLDKTKIIINKIKLAENDVYFLDILPSTQYINKINSYLIEKYEFINKKIHLYEILTKEFLEKKYTEKIIKYYYSLNNEDIKNNSTIKDIIKHRIIDLLFDYIIENNI